jgi:hypothetical protein
MREMRGKDWELRQLDDVSYMTKFKHDIGHTTQV